jgi:quinol monooxygenase YgiN
VTLLDNVLHRIPETGEVNVIATRKVVPGKQEKFEAILKEMETGTLANDKGCLRYVWYRSDAPHTYSLLERWADQAAGPVRANKSETQTPSEFRPDGMEG